MSSDRLGQARLRISPPASKIAGFRPVDGQPLHDPRAWRSVRPSGRRRSDYFAAERECPRVTAFDHRPRDHPGPGTKIGQALKIDIVQDAGAVEREGAVA